MHIVPVAANTFVLKAGNRELCRHRHHEQGELKQHVAGYQSTLAYLRDIEY